MSNKKLQQKNIKVRVISNKTPGMLVAVKESYFKHPKYSKILSKSSRVYVDISEEIKTNIGDIIEIRSSRPLSRLKRWVFVSKISN